MKHILFLILGLFLCGAGGIGDPIDDIKVPNDATKNSAQIDELQALADAGDYRTVIRKGIPFGKKNKDPRAFNLVAYSYRQLGQFQKAIKVYKVALKWDPKLHVAMEYLGVAYLNVGNIDEAKKIYQSLRKEAPKLATALKAEAKKKGINL